MSLPPNQAVDADGLRLGRLAAALRQGVRPTDAPSRLGATVGVALATLSGRPLNALRYPANETTCGWYIWGQEDVWYDAQLLDV